MVKPLNAADSSTGIDTDNPEKGLRLEIGPFNVCIQSSLPSIGHHLDTFYGAFDRFSESAFTDFYIKIRKPGNLRNWLKPQVVFEFDDFLPFKPLPLNQAAAHLEWGLNWVIASQSPQYLIVHAAVLEKDSCGILLPGSPGSGKSTLSAGLMADGWRLLSDEMALIELDSLAVQPVPRPVSLKNRSIDIIKGYFPGDAFGPLIPDTLKGTMAHLKAPADAIGSQQNKTRIAHIIFPKYQQDSATTFIAKSRAATCMAVIDNSFNFNILGTEGFDACCDVIDSSHCHDLGYSDLDEAVKTIDSLLDRH